MSRKRYSFTDILARHNSGQTVKDTDELMGRVAQEIIRYGGAGKVTVQFNVRANGDMGVEIEPVISHALPKRQQGKTFYYPSDEGLFREPPADEADAMLGLNVTAHPTRKE